MDKDIEKMLERVKGKIEAKKAEQHAKIQADDRHELIENTVTKSNALARAHYRFDLVEKRVMEALVSQLNPRLADEKKLQDLELKVVDYAKTFGVSEKIAYRDLAKAVHDLMRTIITIKPDPTKKRKTEYTLMAKADYIENEGKIICTFNQYITPDLIGLRQQFSSYPLTNAANFKSSYTWRLYEIMVSWAQPKKLTDGLFIGWFNVSVEELRNQLGMPETYQWVHVNDTLTKVLDELKEKANIHTSMERIKTSRKITHLKFEFCEKPKDKSEVK